MEKLVTNYVNRNTLLSEGFNIAYQLREIFQEDKPYLKSMKPEVLSFFISSISGQIKNSPFDFDISIYRASRIVSVLPEKRTEFDFPTDADNTQRLRFEIEKGTPWDQYISLCFSRLVWFPKLIDFARELTLEQEEDLKLYLNPNNAKDLEWHGLAKAKVLFKSLIPENISFYLDQAQEDVLISLKYARETDRDDAWEIFVDHLYHLQVLNASDIVLTDHGWHLIQKQEEVRETESSIPERRKY